MTSSFHMHVYTYTRIHICSPTYMNTKHIYMNENCPFSLSSCCHPRVAGPPFTVACGMHDIPAFFSQLTKKSYLQARSCDVISMTESLSAYVSFDCHSEDNGGVLAACLPYYKSAIALSLASPRFTVAQVSLPSSLVKSPCISV